MKKPSKKKLELKSSRPKRKRVMSSHNDRERRKKEEYLRNRKVVAIKVDGQIIGYCGEGSTLDYTNGQGNIVAELELKNLYLTLNGLEYINNEAHKLALYHNIDKKLIERAYDDFDIQPSQVSSLPPHTVAFEPSKLPKPENDKIKFESEKAQDNYDDAKAITLFRCARGSLKSCQETLKKLLSEERYEEASGVRDGINEYLAKKK